MSATHDTVRRGTVYRRCKGCGNTLQAGARRCGKCKDSRYSWAYKVDLARPGEKRRQKTASGFPDKGAALAALQALQADAEAQKAPDPAKDRQTFGGYLSEWLVGRGRYTPKGQPLAPGSYDARRLHVEKYTLPHSIAAVLLRELSEDDLAAFYAHLAAHGRLRKNATKGSSLSAKSVFNIHRTLHRALVDAMKSKDINRNPASDVPGMGKPREKPAAFWTSEQLRAFYGTVVDDRWVTLWRVAGQTGLRRSELAGLRWSDIDLEKRRISMFEQRAKGGGTVNRQTLKGYRARVIALDATTTEALRELREQQMREQERWPGPWGNDEFLVFCHEDGTPLHPDSITKLFARRMKVAGLPKLTLHGLRHSHGAALVASGEHPKVAQERLGHSSATITLDVYSHVAPGMDEAAADRIAAMVDGGN